MRNMDVFKQVLMVAALFFCVSCEQQNTEDSSGKRLPSPVFAANGIKFGNAFISAEGSIKSVRFLSGIDSSTITFETEKCGGTLVQGSYSVVRNMGDFVSELDGEISHGIFRGKTEGEFAVVREVRLSVHDEELVSHAKLKVSAQDNECAYEWFVNSISVVPWPDEAK